MLPWKIFHLYDFPWFHTFDTPGSLKVSHSFLQDTAIQAFVDLSSVMTTIISCAALLHDRRDLSWDALHNRGAMQVVPVVFRCFHCQDETGGLPRMFRNVIAQLPQVVSVRQALITPSIRNLSRNTDVLCSFLKQCRLSTGTFSSRFASQQATEKAFPAYERLTATTSATNLQF